MFPSEPEMSLGVWIERRREEVEATLASRLPALPASDDPGRLVEAMRYSLLSPGKRLRPLLGLAAASSVAPAPDRQVLVACAAVELVHAYSLVHDDLPAMDDDDFRRGRPSNHKVFGEATAILAGDALLTLAFEWIAEAGLAAERAADFGRASLALARGAGAAGMVRGQARDLGEPSPGSVAELERLHGEKTAALFRAAVEVGGAAAGAGPAELDALRAFGWAYGVAFQHVDDLDDADHPHLASEARRRIGALIDDAVAAARSLPRTEKELLVTFAEDLRARALKPSL
jgi:geranylgeranyl diphosphate synthase type II